MEYSDLEFDEDKFYLGTLCKRGHDWNNTGASLRYHPDFRRELSGRDSGRCVNCTSLSACKKYENSKVKLFCENCGVLFERSKYNNRRPKKGGTETYCWSCSYLAKSTRVEIECAECGDIVYRRPRDSNPKKRAILCSKECHRTYYLRKYTKICRVCNRLFVHRKDRVKHCSYRCSLIGRGGYDSVEDADYRHREGIKYPLKYLLLCKKCFKEFETSESTRKFCSRDCYREYWIDTIRPTLTAEVNPALRIRGVMKTCNQCSKSFYDFPSGDKVYCSKACANIGVIINPEKPCGYCGEIYKPPNNYSIYCSQKCFGLATRDPLNHFTSKRERVRFSKLKTRDWKGVIRIIESGKAPDIIVVKGMESIKKFTDLRIKLNDYKKNKEWREYVMALQELAQISQEAAIALLQGIDSRPQFLVKSAIRQTEATVKVLQEETNRVVVNAFNHPDQIIPLLDT